MVPVEEVVRNSVAAKVVKWERNFGPSIMSENNYFVVLEQYCSRTVDDRDGLDLML